MVSLRGALLTQQGSFLLENKNVVSILYSGPAVLWLSWSMNGKLAGQQRRGSNVQHKNAPFKIAPLNMQLRLIFHNPIGNEVLCQSVQCYITKTLETKC